MGLFDKLKDKVKEKTKDMADETTGGAVSEAEDIKDQIDEAKEDLEEAAGVIKGEDEDEDD